MPHTFCADAIGWLEKELGESECPFFSHDMLIDRGLSGIWSRVGRVELASQVWPPHTGIPSDSSPSEAGEAVLRKWDGARMYENWRDPEVDWCAAAFVFGLYEALICRISHISHSQHRISRFYKMHWCRRILDLLQLIWLCELLLSSQAAVSGV